MRRIRLQVKRTTAGTDWYVVLVAGNGEPVMVGESYTRRASAVRAAERLRALVATAEIEIVE